MDPLALLSQGQLQAEYTDAGAGSGDEGSLASFVTKLAKKQKKAAASAAAAAGPQPEAPSKRRTRPQPAGIATSESEFAALGGVSHVPQRLSVEALLGGKAMSAGLLKAGVKASLDKVCAYQ